MTKTTKRMKALVGFIFLVLFATFPACFSQDSQFSHVLTKSASNRFGSSAIFLLQGNVYPLGYYSVHIKIGNPPKVYDLDIDTGSDFTWVQCDAPCTGCTKPRHLLYKPKPNNLVNCVDPVCAAMYLPGKPQCKDPKEQCDYQVNYADQGSSLGVIVKDNFPLRLVNGSNIDPRLAFGCGYNQKYSGSHSPPSTAGVLGLGNGKVNIVSQLRNIGITKNVLGHCLSERGGGFLFFGDDLVPSSGIVWTPISSNPTEGSSIFCAVHIISRHFQTTYARRSVFSKHYSSGPAELVFGGTSTGVKGLTMIFDSGSSYTYFNSQAYQATVNLIKKDLNGKPLKDAAEDKSLSICWKGKKPFKSVGDVKNYFKPLVLSFTNAKNVQLQLSPEAYLIVTRHGNACLGILNGSEVGLGNLNIIGDISMQDKMVVYDNEKRQIGWAPANCDRLPNIDRDYNEGFSRPHAANLDSLVENYLAFFAS